MVTRNAPEPDLRPEAGIDTRPAREFRLIGLYDIIEDGR